MALRHIVSDACSSCSPMEMPADQRPLKTAHRQSDAVAIQGTCTHTQCFLRVDACTYSAAATQFAWRIVQCCLHVSDCVLKDNLDIFDDPYTSVYDHFVL